MKKTLLSCGAAILTGIFIVTLWAPFDQSGNVWFALVPLLLLLRQSLSLKHAFGMGWLAGVVSWVGQLAWMSSLTDNGGPWYLVFPALLGLSAVLSLYMGLFAVLVVFLRQKMKTQQPGVKRMLAVFLLEPALWAGTECLRATLFTGFAWNPLALATTSMLPIAQVAAFGGTFALSALVVAINGAIATLLERFWWSATHRAPTDWCEKLLLSLESGLPLMALLVVFCLGQMRLRTYYHTLPEREAIVVVEHTQNPSIFEADRPTFSVWDKGKEMADLIPFFKADVWVWPESAVSECIFPNSYAQNQLTRLAQQADVPLLVGGLFVAPNGGFYNAALLFTKEGLCKQQIYGKRHLVPFGEYIPFDKEIPWLQQFVPCGTTCEPGVEVSVITLPSGLKIGPLICFEDTVASVARASVADGAQLLVNMSNDAWYASSSEPEQHARQAILRCIETGVPMVRSTNQGVNTVIDAVGNAQVTIGIPTRVPIMNEPFAASYLKYGEMVFGVPCAMFVLGLLFYLVVGGVLKKKAAVLSLLFAACFTANALRAEDVLLPTAEMAIDDGNVTLAERTVQSVLEKVGLMSEDRARAQEVLIRAALKKGEWDIALQRIEACSELPAAHRLAFTLAALSGKGDFAKVLEVYDNAIVSTDEEWGVTALRYGLLAAKELGKKRLAAKLFEEVQRAKGASELVKAENALAWNAYLPSDASRKALLEAAVNADRGGIFLSCALALPMAFASQEVKPAVDCLEEVLKLSGLSTTIEAQLALAVTALQPEYSEKVASARRAVKVVRDERVRQEALSVLGDLLCRQEATFDEGITCLQQAIALNPSAQCAPQIQYRIAELLQTAAKNEAALRAYDRFLESYDISNLAVAVRQGKGRVLVALERYDEALSVFLDAVSLAENLEQRSDLRVEAVDAAIAAGRYSRAIELCRQLLRDGARSGITLRLARSLEASGDVDAAKREYAAVRDDVSSSETDVFTAVMRLCHLLIKEQNHTEALAEYTRLLSDLKSEELLSQVRLERGRTYYLCEDLKRACEDFEALTSATSDIAEEARFFMVLCLYRLGEDERAHTLAQAYMETYPESERIPDVMLWLAKSDFNQGDYEKAMNEFIAFTERWQTDERVPQALYLAALSAFQHQDYVVTVEWIALLAQKAPSAACLANARFLQAEALVELARYAEARDLLEALIRRYPEATWLAEAYGLRGDCLVYTAVDDPKRYALALEAYREALARVEEDPDVSLMYLYKIGRTLERQKHRDEAAEQYTKLIYRVLNRPEISAMGKQWFQKALTQLHAIERARGNLAAFETLLQRVRRTQLTGVELP